MKYRFLLDDVKIKVVNEVVPPSDYSYDDKFTRVSENSFYLDVPGIAKYLAENGKIVCIEKYPKAKNSEVELFLNGSVLGAILHQRQHFPLHASSFNFRDNPIIICGESCAGKCSITAALCLDGAEFLTDDITPLEVHEGKFFITPISDSLKLWGDTVDTLEINKNELVRIRNDRNKFYWKKSSHPKKCEVKMIIHVETGPVQDVQIEEIMGTTKFELLLNQIYRKEYIKAMTVAKKTYFDYIVKLSKSILVYNVIRPEKIHLLEFKETLAELIIKRTK